MPGPTSYVLGTSGNDLLNGGNVQSHTILGYGGDDQIFSTFDGTVDNHDWIEGGAGADNIIAYYGETTYVFRTGDLVAGDTIEDQNGYHDEIRFLIYNGGQPADITVLSASGIEILIDEQGDGLRMQTGWAAAILRTPRVDFANGGSVTLNSNSSQLHTVNLNAAGNTLNSSNYAAALTVNGNAGADTVIAGAFNDTINGNGGNDTLTGGGGIDSLDGGDGNDTLNGGAGADTVLGGDGDDTLVIATGDVAAGEYLLGGVGFDTLSIGTATGLSFANAILGGLERLQGTGQTVTLTVAQADAFSVIDAVSITLADGGTLQMSGVTINGATTTINLSAAGNTIDLSNVIGTSNAFIVTGNSGADTISGSLGNDTLSGNGGDDSLYAGAGNDILAGGDGANILHGGDGDDVLSGGSGADQFEGGSMVFRFVNGVPTVVRVDTGIDRITYASAGAGVTVDLSNNAAQNTGGGGTDTIYGIENLTGSAFADTLTGSSVANIIAGGAGDDGISGRAGNDILDGGDGNDALFGDEGDDLLLSSAGDDYFFGGGLFGETSGIDTVSYASATAGITVSLALTTAQNTGGAGIDQMAQIENLIGSTFNDNLTGSSVANIITGGAGDDGISGGDGNDTLDGGEGNDALFGDAGDDLLLSSAGDDWFFGGGLFGETGGIDTVSYAGAAGGITFSLALTTAQNTGGAGTDQMAQIENLFGSAFNDVLVGSAVANVLEGGTGNDSLYGLAGNDTLIGGEGNDYLSGGSGADVMDGGVGDDIFIVDEIGDVMTEVVGGGYDSVYSNTSSPYVLTAGAEIELLGTYGSGNVDLYGNEFAQAIYGGAGNNYLSGGAGSDAMAGGGGDDTYIVDNIGDSIQDAVGGGYDSVYSNTSSPYVLTAGAEIELLGTYGTGNVDLYGNEFGQSIWGGAGNNYLSGGGGADSMRGLGGNDTYIVDNAGDHAFEGTGEGYDSVYTNVNYILTAGSEIELLGVYGGAANPLVLYGNEFGQSIYGGDGNDTMRGNGGNDVIVGNGGTDSAVFAGLMSSYTITVSGGVATVVDNDAAADGNDGSDTIYSVETLRFKNGETFSISGQAASSASPTKAEVSRQLMQMTQDMASFGGKMGEGLWGRMDTRPLPDSTGFYAIS